MLAERMAEDYKDLKIKTWRIAYLQLPESAIRYKLFGFQRKLDICASRVGWDILAIPTYGSNRWLLHRLDTNEELDMERYVSVNCEFEKKKELSLEFFSPYQGLHSIDADFLTSVVVVSFARALWYIGLYRQRHNNSYQRQKEETCGIP